MKTIKRKVKLRVSIDVTYSIDWRTGDVSVKDELIKNIGVGDSGASGGYTYNSPFWFRLY